MKPIEPHVVVLSGSINPGSGSELLAHWCAEQCESLGASTTVFDGADLDFPFYRPGVAAKFGGVQRFLAELELADAVVLISPAYHGSVTGLLKNALDYVNEIAGPRPFLDGRPIGCITLSAGAQGGGSTLACLRTIAHALRGWPTPLGVTLTRAQSVLAPTGEADVRCVRQMRELVSQVLLMARAHARRDLVAAAG
ncbi:NADPH-dependent FMN reductase [Nocardia gipuzkoensis]